MERRKCRRCGYPMTRIITQTIEPGGSRWKAYYTCLSCDHKIVAAPAGSRAEAEKGLEDFAAMIDQEYKTADTRSAAPTKPRPAEADRALKAYGLYCQLCETLTGKPIAKMDELLTAAKKARRDQAISDGAYKQCEAENTKLKEMAAEDILRAALSGYPCNSCVNNTLDVLCDCDCADCEHHCTCHECHDSESYVWRGGK